MSKYSEENLRQVSRYWRKELQYGNGEQNERWSRWTKITDVNVKSFFIIIDIKINADIGVNKCVNMGKYEPVRVYIPALYTEVD